MKTYMLTTDHIDLQIELGIDTVTLSACFINTPLSTKKMGGVISMLDTKLPTIFRNRCFNEDHQSFRQEVRSTEIGHLFEHVLMEYMCIEHESSSYTPIKINGLTSWNWYQEPVGTFTIELKSADINEHTFIRALNQTIAFFEDVLLMQSMPLINPTYTANLPESETAA